MNEYRILRVLLIPLVLIVLFFIIVPRMCARAVVQVRQQQTAAETATHAGLQIESSTPAPAEAKGSAFPEGLDAARIQYLVEIDPQFSAPRLATLPRAPKSPDPVVPALTKLQYAERQADGSMALTRDGSLKLSGLTEQPEGWTFEIARRVFDKVSFVDRVEDDKYRATMAWHWDPNAVGQELKIDTKPHSATAEFAGGERHWALTNWVAQPSDVR
jgi:hypothetical protein